MGNENISAVKIWIVIIILVLGVTSLSVFVLSKQSLRLDESQSIWQTSHSFHQMLFLIAQDVHVPFYHIILNTWQRLFGNSVSTNRDLSLIFFVLSIPVFYILGESMYNRRIALFATLLYCISPIMNWYGNEIRMYSLLSLITLISQYFFVKFFNNTTNQKTTWAWIGYTISTLFGIYTHYFFFLVLLTQAIFFIIHRKSFSSHTLKRGIVVTTITIAAIIPWLVYVRILGKISNSEPIFLRPSTIDVFNTFSQFMFGFQTDPINTILVSLWPITVLLAFLSLQKNTRVSLNTIYMIYSLLLPNAVLFILSYIFTPAYLTRYLVFTAPALYLLISWLFSNYPPQIARIARVIFVMLMFLTLTIEVVSLKTPVKENYLGVTEYLAAHATSKDVIAVSAPFTIYPVEYYDKSPTKIGTLPIWDRTKIQAIPPFIESNLPQEVNSLAEGHQNFWLLQSYNQGYQEKMRIYFDTHFQRLQSINFSPGLDLYEYKLRYDNN